MMRHRLAVPLLLALAAATPAMATDDALQQRVAARLRESGPGTRFGLLVTTAEGREIVAINPEQRFIPASNTKVFTTATAFATLAALDRPDADGGATVRLDGAGRALADVIVQGHGDARMSSADDCTVDCLATLADAIAAQVHVVHDVIGDDSAFPDERWSQGMSWNNIPSRSGTGISALSLDNNELQLWVRPGLVGAVPTIDGLAYYTIDNRAVTVAAGRTSIAYDRLPLQRRVRITGTIVAGAPPERIRMGIDDPADYAAWRLQALLIARGVRVTGAVGVRHRPLMAGDDPAVRNGTPPARPPAPAVLARLMPGPLIEDVQITNKVSQNLHAELMLRRIGRIAGGGSVADGLAAVRAMLTQAGVPRADYDVSDGSGMSTYNRVTPRGMVILLRWIAAQPWGAAFRETLPIGGVDGTIGTLFKGTALARKVFAKTGSLNATSALSGYLVAASGQTLLFASFANDVPDGASATDAVAAALLLVAAAN